MEKTLLSVCFSGAIYIHLREFFPKMMTFSSFFVYILAMEDQFWDRVKRLMKSHKISQKDFARYLDIPIRTFWGWIHRDCIPDASRACRIAQALGVTVEYLVMGTDDFNAEDRMHRTFERKSAAEEIRKLTLKIEEQADRLK